MLRFDGLYQSQEKDFFLYLRFYPDGSVLWVSTDGNPEQVFTLLDKHHPQVSSGAYTLQGDAIAFSASNQEGMIEYQGHVGENSLVLQVYSHINGHQDEEHYHFVEVFPVLFEGEPVVVRVRCTDALRFTDGNFGDVEEWVFFLRAPSGWVYAPALHERITRLAARLYEGFNWHNELHPVFDDGSRYVLGGVEAAILSEEEAGQRPWRGQPFYQLQAGESVKMINPALNS